MSKRHAFDQGEVVCAFASHDKWVKFKKICDALGFYVRVTGGVVLTHEFGGTKKDFEIVLELTNDFRVN
jgi:hypothetical protein